MEALIIAVTVVFVIWWLNLDRPARSLARSVDHLAKAGEIKAANILADTADNVELSSLASAKEKLEALRSLDV